MSIPKRIDALSEYAAMRTKHFVETTLGRLFLSLVLLGPVIFVPQLYQAWTAPNIDAIRNLTWPLLTLVNCAGLLSLIHNGDWRTRLVTALWALIAFLMTLAIIVR